MAAESSITQRRSYSWDGSLSFKREMWEELGHTWVGIKAVGTHIFLPQHKKANFCPISCSNKNLSLTHRTLSCPRWQPEVGPSAHPGHPSLASYAADYPAGSLWRLGLTFHWRFYLRQWHLQWFFLLLVVFQYLQFGWIQFLQCTKKCSCNSCIFYSST